MKAGEEHSEKFFKREVSEKEIRKLKALQNKRSVWSGFGLFGMVGWSIVVPTLLGIAFGWWLDGLYPQKFSWTLSLLITGLFIGCLIAWHWVNKEHKEIHQNEDKDE